MAAPSEDVDEHLSKIFTPVGFEYYPFKIGWYNEIVDPIFKLDYPDDTLAYIIVSTPGMFEKAFVPYVCRLNAEDARDPVDQCIDLYYQKVKEAFPDHDIEVIHDYDLHANRRPKILVQTAGHVAGAAYYYQRKDVKNDPWEKDQKIFGVSVHPLFGGWFGFRGVIIFKDIQKIELEKKEPVDCIQGDELRIQVLEKFTYHWADNSFRDIIPVVEKYSDEQKVYFNTLPAERRKLLESLGIKIGQQDSCKET
ncbi:cyanocobalamin reductase / alkylcobalamin dealkylase-like [Saccoglossus kowalevskii]|uniref:Cyanocobalamin reductase (cyanide-eliminating) n=1 Tax=Saccoglossus kowalevskii TaxID=10224 RepID=A0ABM0GL29_SACKO|nr:PREDICTED: methylmalonic aciduria and homocystinuria type C protein homolog [Saccoglossus kowalevskii]